MQPIVFDVCPSCHRPTGEGAAVCPHCNYPYNAEAPPLEFQRRRYALPPTLPLIEEEEPPPVFHLTLIVTMWAIFLSSGIVFMIAPRYVLVVDGIAALLALLLTRSKHQLDRVNGLINLALSAGAIVVCALMFYLPRP